MGKSPLIEQLRACTSAAKNFAVSKVVEALESVSSALDEMETSKADKLAAVSFTIPVSGWQQDSTADYPYYYDLTVNGVTASDRADVAVAPAEIKAAADCGLCPGTETLAGKIRLRAASVPAKSMTAVYWLEKGKG